MLHCIALRGPGLTDAARVNVWAIVAVIETELGNGTAAKAAVDAAQRSHDLEPAVRMKGMPRWANDLAQDVLEQMAIDQIMPIVSTEALALEHARVLD